MSKLTYRWDCTCGACPEQYDIYLGDKLIAYFRLRWGGFYVAPYDEYGSIMRDVVICSGTYGDGCMTGCLGYDDREKFMSEIEHKITEYLLKDLPCEQKEIKNWSFN